MDYVHQVLLPGCLATAAGFSWSWSAIAALSFCGICQEVL